MLILVRIHISIRDTAFINIANPNEPTVNLRMKLSSKLNGTRNRTYANDFKTPPRFNEKLRRHLSFFSVTSSKAEAKADGGSEEGLGTAGRMRHRVRSGEGYILLVEVKK